MATRRLGYREPFDPDPLLGFFAARAIPGVEELAAGRYTRTVRTAAGPGVISLIPPPGHQQLATGAGHGPRAGDADQAPAQEPGQVLLEAWLPGVTAHDQAAALDQAAASCRQLFDLDADPALISAALAADPVLAPLVRARPGLRLPGCYDGFELAIRAVLGQQVSVAAARTFAGRIAARFGTPLPAGLRARFPALAVAFPGPAELAGGDLSGLGLTTGRQRTLHAVASAAAAGRLALDRGTEPAEMAAGLAGLPGIGPWTISYILLRAGRDTDAFPASDLGLRRMMDRLGCAPGDEDRWRPWRGYAAQHLWTEEAARQAAAKSQGAASGRSAAKSQDAGKRIR